MYRRRNDVTYKPPNPTTVTKYPVSSLGEKLRLEEMDPLFISLVVDKRLSPQQS